MDHFCSPRTTEVSRQPGGNMPTCVAQGQTCVTHHRALVGPYNSDQSLNFLSSLLQKLTETVVEEQPRNNQTSGTVWASTGIVYSCVEKRLATEPDVSVVLPIPEQGSKGTTTGCMYKLPSVRPWIEPVRISMRMPAGAGEVFPCCLVQENKFGGVDENLWLDTNMYTLPKRPFC